MRLPFLRPKGDGPIRVPIPETLNPGYGIYLTCRDTPPGPEELMPEVAEWVQRHAGEPLRSAVGEFIERGLISIQVGGKDLLPTPPGELLRAFRPGELEERRYEEATHLAVVWAADLLLPLRVGFWSALAGARAIAGARHGVILDPVFPRLLDTGSCTEALPGDGRIPVGRHILIPQSVDERGQAWITTRGLSKFGLPELEIRNAPPNLASGFTLLLTGLGQCLAELVTSRNAESGQRLTELLLQPEIRISLRHVAAAYGEEGPSELPEGARGWSIVRLEHHPGRKGQDSFLRLVPPRGTRTAHGEWLNGLLLDLFGTEDTLRNVQSDSEAMEAAHLRAVDELPRVKERFAAGLAPGETLFVKHGFPARDHGHEYMWLVVNTWTGDRIQAQLANDPQIRMDLRAGQRVELREADVFDWLILRPDGSMEGGYTNRVVGSEGTQG